MISKAKFEPFLRAIITEFFPEELEIFDFEGGNVVTDLFEGEPILDDADDLRRYHFSAGREKVVGFAKVAEATYAMTQVPMGQLRRSDGKIHPSRAWRLQLTGAGLAESKADDITKRFRNDFVQLLGELPEGPPLFEEPQ